MKTLSIRFTIESQDETQQYVVAGKQVDNAISFIDPHQERHIIEQYPNKLIYWKKGIRNLHFVFQIGKPSQGNYTISGHEFRFTIKTLHLQIENGHIHVEYQLLQLGELVNQAKLELFYNE